jgi:hypothetical protein
MYQLMSIDVPSHTGDAAFAGLFPLPGLPVVGATSRIAYSEKWFVEKVTRSVAVA